LDIFWNFEPVVRSLQNPNFFRVRGFSNKFRIKNLKKFNGGRGPEIANPREKQSL